MKSILQFVFTNLAEANLEIETDKNIKAQISV